MRKLLLLVLAVALLAAPPAAGGSLPLTTRLADALAVRGISPALSGAVAVDLSTGNVVFARHADLPLAPASNEKLTVTYAALHDLGLDYRFKTEVLGRGTQVGSTWQGDLFLKGFGDPTLTTPRLDRLAQAVAATGITRIDGRLFGDESWFDARRTAPGWKAGYLVNECPPLSALVVDRAEYDNHVALNPALAAAGTFRRLLRVHGVATGPVGVGVAPGTVTEIAESDSATLPNVVAVMDRESDNFRAEMLLKTLGAEEGRRRRAQPSSAAISRRRTCLSLESSSPTGPDSRCSTV